MDYTGEGTGQVKMLKETCFLDSGGQNDLGRAYCREGLCVLMYSVYGSNLLVTKIIAKLIDNKKRGGHPRLRIVAQ